VKVTCNGAEVNSVTIRGTAVDDRIRGKPIAPLIVQAGKNFRFGRCNEGGRGAYSEGRSSGDERFVFDGRFGLGTSGWTAPDHRRRLSAPDDSFQERRSRKTTGRD